MRLVKNAECTDIVYSITTCSSAVTSNVQNRSRFPFWQCNYHLKYLPKATCRCCLPRSSRCMVVLRFKTHLRVRKPSYASRLSASARVWYTGRCSSVDSNNLGGRNSAAKSHACVELYFSKIRPNFLAWLDSRALFHVSEEILLCLLEMFLCVATERLFSYCHWSPHSSYKRLNGMADWLTAMA